MPTQQKEKIRPLRRSRRLLPTRVREGLPVRYVADVVAAPCCFVCGYGAEAGPLEGSGHAGDWVHAACLAQPVDW